ncbi:MAG TPA: glycosyltransferase family 2 protein [Solirubrobacterales bacterium]|nr:glycosyltransferase family 2 protein [Solirubrobacterales bacterium]
MAGSESPTFSFVLPVHNEAGNLDELYRRIATVMEGVGEPFEVIFVDDGSYDESLEVMKAIRGRDLRVKLVSFSRNFGHQAAITAGLDLSRGDATIVMDSDLQHPPEVVPRMISSWREGFEIVNAIRADRSGETVFKRFTARMFYWLLCRLSHIEMSPNVGDFRLIDRKALDAFKSLRESTRYLRGMFSWVGFRQTALPYEYRDRHAGEPKYNFRRMLTFAVNGLVSFSNAPLELALHIGFVVAGLSFLAGIGDLVAKILAVDTVPGWLSITITVSFLGGMQLLILGVMGIYMSRMYEEIKSRPLYIVREVDGIDGVATSVEKAYVVGMDLGR